MTNTLVQDWEKEFRENQLFLGTEQSLQLPEIGYRQIYRYRSTS
jgi:hypothetical protein